MASRDTLFLAITVVGSLIISWILFSFFLVSAPAKTYTVSDVRSFDPDLVKGDGDKDCLLRPIFIDDNTIDATRHIFKYATSNQSAESATDAKGSSPQPTVDCDQKVDPKNQSDQTKAEDE